MGVCGLALSAQADVFNPNFTVLETHSVGAGTTAGSFAASAMMGAKGHSNLALLPSWESSITSQCAAAGAATIWPGNCNPTKMASALVTLTGRSWVQSTWLSTDQASALNIIVSALKDHGSPAVVPIYGQADHWVAVTQVTATGSGSSWTINQVKFFDGGPVGGTDGGFNSYEGGLLSYGGSAWKNVYFRVLENINPSCDPCTGDPWYDHYVIMWEPPPGQEHTNIVANYARSPGVFQGAASERLAQIQVWNSLTAAGIHQDAQIWNAISGGQAGHAFEVNGVAPTGDRWDYFLVPIMSDAHTVTAFVQLAADDGAFESVHVLPQPKAFNPVQRNTAQLLARTALGAGESLTPGILTWDPRAQTPFAKAPTFPYYEFAVVNQHQQVGVVRVSFDNGTVIRSAQ
jgi:hypothetical protein